MSALQSAPVRLLSRARAEQFSRLLLEQGAAPFSSETIVKAPSAPSTSDAPTAPKPEKEEAWTEVVHSTGQIYYWNQKTGAHCAALHEGASACMQVMRYDAC